DRELELAVEHGVSVVIADNVDELERLDRVAQDAGRRQPVLVRVTPGVEGHTHAYVDTGGAHSKFGTPIAEGLALQAIKQAVALGEGDSPHRRWWWSPAGRSPPTPRSRCTGWDRSNGRRAGRRSPPSTAACRTTSGRRSMEVATPWRLQARPGASPGLRTAWR